jgi:hypothetical protein
MLQGSLIIHPSIDFQVGATDRVDGENNDVDTRVFQLQRVVNRSRGADNESREIGV